MHKTTCPYCHKTFKCDGAQAFKHSLTPGLVRILMKMAKKAKETNLEPVKISWDHGILKGSELGNYTKLHYFSGLIVPYKEEGKTRTAKWVVTRQGFAFLRGEYLVPKYVITKNAKVIDQSTEHVSIHTYKQHFDETWQIDFINNLMEESKVEHRSNFLQSLWKS